MFIKTISKYHEVLRRFIVHTGKLIKFKEVVALFSTCISYKCDAQINRKQHMLFKTFQDLKTITYTLIFAILQSYKNG